MAVDADNVTKRAEPREPSASELQREIEAKRTSLTHTIAEMKTTMNTEYQNAKETISNTFDWRLQMRRYPLAVSLGALAVGFIAGKIISDQLGGEDESHPMLSH